MNHEVGHAIGHDREVCAGPVRVTPVTMQQTKGAEGMPGELLAVPVVVPPGVAAAPRAKQEWAQDSPASDGWGWCDCRGYHGTACRGRSLPGVRLAPDEARSR